MTLPRLLVVAREADPAWVAELRALGFPTMVVDDVRAVPTALSFRPPDVVLLDLPSFEPSGESAFDAVHAVVHAPLIVLDGDEGHLLSLLRRGADDGCVRDGAGAWRVVVPGLLRRATARGRRGRASPTASSPLPSLLASLPGATLALDEEGRAAGANDAARALLGWLEELDPDASVFDRLGLSPELVRRLALSGEVSVDLALDATQRVEVRVRATEGGWPDGVRYLCTVRELREAERRLQLDLEQVRGRRVVEHAGDILLLHDTEARIVDANLQATLQIGYTREELLNLRVWDLDPQARPGAGIWARLAEGGAMTVEAAMTRKDGSSFPTEVRVSAWEDGGRKLIVAFIRDISERRKAQEDQRLARAVFDAVADGIMVTDTANRIVAINPAFTTITGFGADEVIGRRPSVLSSGRQPPEFYTAFWQRLQETGSWEGELWNRRKDGSEYPEWLSVSSLRGPTGRVERYVGVFSNIAERKRAEEIIRHQAFHDGLTGLPNRVAFHERLAAELDRARLASTHVALLFLDLDRFKEVNDTEGHEMGDRLLRQVAARLAACARHTDLVARLGGDEFTMILPGLESPDAIRDVPARVLRALETPFDLGDYVARISGSVGVAFFPDDADSVDALVRCADHAMYDAKAARNTVVAYRSGA